METFFTYMFVTPEEIDKKSILHKKLCDFYLKQNTGIASGVWPRSLNTASRFMRKSPDHHTPIRFGPWPWRSAPSMDTILCFHPLFHILSDSFRHPSRTRNLTWLQTISNAFCLVSAADTLLNTMINKVHTKLCQNNCLKIQTRLIQQPNINLTSYLFKHSLFTCGFLFSNLNCFHGTELELNSSRIAKISRLEPLGWFYTTHLLGGALRSLCAAVFLYDGPSCCNTSRKHRGQ